MIIFAVVLPLGILSTIGITLVGLCYTSRPRPIPHQHSWQTEAVNYTTTGAGVIPEGVRARQFEFSRDWLVIVDKAMNTPAAQTTIRQRCISCGLVSVDNYSGDARDTFQQTTSTTTF